MLPWKVNPGGKPLPNQVKFRFFPFLTESASMIEVGIVMGSNSDWEVMQNAARVLKDFGIAFETRVVSAHRTPDLLFQYAETAEARGLKAIIAGAGGAAHLPGMLAAKTHIPVLGVPVPSKYLRGEDSLLSIVQMPKGIPVATFAIGEAGAANAGLFAIAMLATGHPELAAKLKAFRKQQEDTVLAMSLPEVQ
jgi:5-(carboxyamino)imidazole ribonucleotide mutase